MPAIFCPHCKAKINAPEKASGKSVNCPGCKQGFQAPVFSETLPMLDKAQRALTTIPWAEPIQQVVPRPAHPVPFSAPIAIVVSVPASQDLDTRRCRFCAEPIHAEAVKCKHCGEFLVVALRKTMAPAPVQIINNVNVNASAAARSSLTLVTEELKPRWDPSTAAVLSFLLPGAGQIYKGELINGVCWFLVVALGYVAMIVPGVILHLCCIVGASMGDPYR